MPNMEARDAWGFSRWYKAWIQRQWPARRERENGVLHIAAGTRIRASILPQAHKHPSLWVNKQILTAHTQSAVEGRIHRKQCQHEDPASGLDLSKHGKRERERRLGWVLGWVNEVEQCNGTQGNPNPKCREDLVLLDTTYCTITGQSQLLLKWVRNARSRFLCTNRSGS